jgi:hypothetical protein
MSVDRDVDLEQLIGDDAFGRTTQADKDHLRSPQMRFQVRSTLRLMIASMEDQLRSRAATTTQWRESTERYVSRLRVALVEYDGLCEGQESVYRKAIEAHRDGWAYERDQSDDSAKAELNEDLWSVLE